MKLISSQNSSPSRDGLSIVEVLVSIIVAMIGVFGVMILIPFAIKQAKSGLDKDASVIVARNAYSQFEIAGFRSPNNWVVNRSPVLAVTPYSPYSAADVTDDGFPDDVNGDGPLTDLPVPLGDADSPAVFSIDPIGITSNLEDSSGNGQFDVGEVQTAHTLATFPFNYRNVDATVPYPTGSAGEPQPWVNLLISSANLRLPVRAFQPPFNDSTIYQPWGMGVAAANRMFRARDDYVYEEAAHELLGPEQVFDITTGLAGLPIQGRRQTEDGISWSAIVVPFKDDPTIQGTTRWAYKMYILVYRDRVSQISASSPIDQMACAMVANGPGMTGLSGSQSPVSTIQLDAGVQFVEDFVFRDDWVMMINQARRPIDTPAGLAETGFHRQLAFYRVVNAADAIVNGAGATVSPALLTLDGPDFIFDDGSSTFSNTYIVHLKNVVGVYERTFEPEFESSWTISN